VASWQQQFRNPVIIVLAAVLAAAVVALIVGRSSGPQPLEISFGEPTPGAGSPIEVYITGAVARPGVYEMADGDRAIDILYEAGGPAPDANLEAINLAVRLHDEDQVVVPRVGEPVSGVAGVVSSTAISINTATAEELATLPGIGEVYSQRIVESRAEDGLFSTTEELVERRIIPRATYERIRELITVGP
jgi:competence protein ComEA